MQPESPEEAAQELDWSSLTEQERAELILSQAVYVELSRKFIHALAMYGTDVRNLILSMAIVLLLNFLSLDNKTVILAMLGFQMFFCFLSKVSETSTLRQLEDARKNYISVIKQKRKKIV